MIEKVLKCTKEHHRKDVADLGYAWQAAEYIVKKYCVLNQARSGSAVCGSEAQEHHDHLLH